MIRGKRNIPKLEEHFVFTESELKQIEMIKPYANNYDAMFIETEKSKIKYFGGIGCYVVLLLGLIIISKGNLEYNMLNTVLYMMLNIYISWEMWTFIFGYNNNYAEFTVKWIRKGTDENNR